MEWKGFVRATGDVATGMYAFEIGQFVKIM